MTITEFHNYRRPLLDYAEKGHTIIITRGGKTFLLTCADVDQNLPPIDTLPEFNSDTGSFAHEFDDIMTTITDVDKFNKEAETYGTRLDKRNRKGV